MADFGKLNFSVSFNPTSGFPLDARYYFDSLSDAQTAASGAVEVGSADGTYFIGENLVVVERDAATLYVIQPNKTLKPVGSTPLGDNKTIVVSPEGVISLNGIADAETGAQPVKQADGSIAWIKPDTTTVEGLSQAVESLDSRVDTVENTLGNERTGLVKQVNDLQTNLSQNYYNKGEIDSKIAGVFTFKGDATRFEDGTLYQGEEPISGMKSGDVYQVGDKEYAYNGEEWVELGFAIDLSQYATTEWTTQQIESAKTELKSYADQAETDAVSTAKSYTDEKVANLVNTEQLAQTKEEAITEVSAAIEAAKEETIYLAGNQADSKITAKVGDLGSADTTVKTYVDTKVQGVEDKVAALEEATEGLGTLAKLNEVAEENLESTLAQKINGKADKGTTLEDYGITDAYKKDEVDTKIGTAKSEAIAEAGTQTDSKINAKVGEIAPSLTVKEYVDGKETALDSKINSIQSTIGDYGDIVTHNASEFETAGAANSVKAELLGTSGDASTANTIYGAKKGVDEAKAAASAAQSAADSKIASVSAGDNSISIGGSGTAPTVAVKIDPVEGNALKAGVDGLKVEMGAAPEYTIEKEASPTEGYFASYVLKKDGMQSGVKIDIPKDYLVKSAFIKESIGEDDPSSLPAGTKYIDFVINAFSDDGQESHIYLNVNDLVSAFTSGNGIEISGENQISVKVVATNGLSVDVSGIQLSLASGSSAGAMSSTHYTKIEGIEAGAQVNKVESVSINGEAISPVGKDVAIPLATAVKLGVSRVDDSSLQVENGVYSIKAVDINLLTQQPDDVLVLDCGTSA